MMFTFNGNHRDLEQVAEFLPAFMDALAELEAAGQYRYNDAFKGRIPAIGNTEKRGPNVGTHEEAAIYLLQGLERKRATAKRVEQALADGYERIESIHRETKFASVVFYDPGRSGEWLEWEDARLIPMNRAHPGPVGVIWGVLPKGRRTNGYSAAGKSVLVKTYKEGKTT